MRAALLATVLKLKSDTLSVSMPLAAIISKPQKPELASILPELIAWLEIRGYKSILDRESAAYLDTSGGRLTDPLDGPAVGAGSERLSTRMGVERTELPNHNPFLVIVLGGDGTLLSAARAFAKTNTRILSVNLGSLGFLTEIPLEDLYPALQAWCDNRAVLDVRSLMRAELYREGKLFQTWDALNDVVLAKGTIARMADFTVEIDQQFVAAFRADGVIVSTPTGSTAYSLAANGPIVMPTVDAMCITPICPHLLTIRPIVVPGDATISVHVEGVPSQTFLTVDGQEAVELQVGDLVHCCKSRSSVRLLRLRSNGLFNVLRSKLKWGER